jgi:dihydrofolate reductase
MRNVIVSTYATLDGRVDELQDWSLAYNSEAMVDYHTALLKPSDGLLLGRRTYEIFSYLWPARAGELPYIDQLNAMAKHVASSRTTDLTWENSHRLEGEVPAAVARLKEGPGQDLVVYGSGSLTATLLRHGLVDEYRVLVHPVLFGQGGRLLPDGGPLTRLTLVDSAVIASGVVVLTYRPA